MKNRYLICLLVTAVMLYFALPELNPMEAGLKGVFAISWIAFAIIVVAGNFSAFLFSPNMQKRMKVKKDSATKIRRVRGR